MKHLDFVLWFTLPLIAFGLIKIAGNLNRVRKADGSQQNNDPQILKPFWLIPIVFWVWMGVKIWNGSELWPLF